MQKMIAFWEVLLRRVLYYACTLLLIGGTLLAIVEVIRRYVFGVSFYWQQDIVVYGIISALFLYFCVTQWDREHLRVSLFVNLLLNRGRVRHRLGMMMNMLAYVPAIAYVVFLLYWGLPAVVHYRAAERLIFSQIAPFWPFFLIGMIGFVLLGITFILQAYQEAQAWRGKKQEEHQI